jgi:hypothetical protein
LQDLAGIQAEYRQPYIPVMLVKETGNETDSSDSHVGRPSSGRMPKEGGDQFAAAYVWL